MLFVCFFEKLIQHCCDHFLIILSTAKINLIIGYWGWFLYTSRARWRNATFYSCTSIFICQSGKSTLAHWKNHAQCLVSQKNTAYEWVLMSQNRAYFMKSWADYDIFAVQGPLAIYYTQCSNLSSNCNSKQTDKQISNLSWGPLKLQWLKS